LQQRMEGKIDSRAALEKTYTLHWNKEFKSRLKVGSVLSSLLRNNKFESLAMNALTKMPFLLHKIIRQTHGKPIKIL